MIKDFISSPKALQRLNHISGKYTDEAQDLTQETLLEMLETGKHYKHIGQFLHDYKRIAWNIARREKRRKEKTHSLNTDTLAHSTPPDVDAVINPPQLAKIARWSYEGMSTTQIARKAHISKTTLTRQRQTLKTTLEAML